MNPWPVEAEVEEVHLPRPGHADLAGIQKFGHTDVRNVLERASARETAARVAAEALAKAYLRELGVEVRSHVTRIGTVTAPMRDGLSAADFEGVDESPVRSLDAGASEAMVAEIDAARKANESLGGEFEVIAFGLVPGIGSHVSWEERLDGRLAQSCRSRRSRAWASATASRWPSGWARRPTTRSSGRTRRLQPRDEPRGRDRGRHDHRRPGRGGRTMKPLPTLAKPLRSVDTETKEPAQALRERTDSCTVPAAGVVGRRWWRWCSPPRTGRSSAGTTSRSDARPRCGRPAPSAGGAHSSRARRLHGGRKVHRRPRARRGARSRAARLRPRARAAARRAGRGLLRRGGRAGVPRASGLRAGAAAPSGHGRDRARRRRDRLGERAPRWRRTPSSTSRSSRRPGAAHPAEPAARPRPRRFAQLHGDRAAVYESVADAVLLNRDALPARPAALHALADAPAGTRLVWASSASGRYPCFSGTA